MILSRDVIAFLQLHRRLHHLVEHAVDAVADAELLLVGLDVDVAARFLIASVRIRLTSLTTGASSDSLLQLADVDVVLVLDELEVLVVEVAHHVVERGGLVVVAVDRAP